MPLLSPVCGNIGLICWYRFKQMGRWEYLWHCNLLLNLCFSWKFKRLMVVGGQLTLPCEWTLSGFTLTSCSRSRQELKTRQKPAEMFVLIDDDSSQVFVRQMNGSALVLSLHSSYLSPARHLCVLSALTSTVLVSLSLPVSYVADSSVYCCRRYDRFSCFWRRKASQSHEGGRVSGSDWKLHTGHLSLAFSP